MVVFPFITVTLLAGVPFTMRAFAWTVAGSTGSVTLTMKSVGAVPVTRLPQAPLVTEQPTSSRSVKASGWYVPLMGTRPSTHEERCLVATAEA